MIGTSPRDDTAERGRFYAPAFHGLMLLVVAVAFMTPAFPLAAHLVTLADGVYLIALPLFGAALLSGAIKLRWHSLYAVLAFYFGAMLLSVLFSAQPAPRSAVKLASQLYLLSLPVMVLHLVRSAAELKRVLLLWLWTAAFVASVGIVTLALFFLHPENPLLNYTLHHKGTLPPGDYPRVDLTFTHPAMLGSYLTVAIMILLVCEHLEWVRKRTARLLLPAMLVSAFFSLTPGLGGVPLAIGTWYWLKLRHAHRTLSLLSLAAGLAGAVLFLLAAAVTPVIHPTAPFLITVPGLGTVAPSARMMFWMGAWTEFGQHALVGKGIGVDPIAVSYMNPSGYLGTWTDAHNVFLSLAVQVGLPGLAALITLIVFVVKRTLPLGPLDERNAVRIGLGLAWLNAFVYQGLVGSFEDARFLWLLLGLFAASLSIDWPDNRAADAATP